MRSKQYFSYSDTPLATADDLRINKSMTIFCIAYGANADIGQLSNITGSIDNVIIANTTIDTAVQSLLGMTCALNPIVSTTAMLPPCSLSTVMYDLIILIDSSKYMGEANFNLVRSTMNVNFVSYFSKYINT